MRRGAIWDLGQRGERDSTLWPYVSDVPLQAPNPQYQEKLSFNRFGPSEKVCYKYAIKVVFKWCLNGLGKIWYHLNII